jgi:hypothetical protein
MDAWMWVVIVAALALLAVGGYFAWQQYQRKQLREGFGPEYDRTVEDAPSRREAEAELAERKKRRDELDIRPLAPAACERYRREWETVQARFVDDPDGSIAEADHLIQQVMRERGYPVDDFDQRAADISVDYPEVVDEYRQGHSIAESAAGGRASTEDLRQALVHYRALFERMLETADDREEARR